MAHVRTNNWSRPAIKALIAAAFILVLGTNPFAANDTVYIGCRGGKTPGSNYASGSRLDSICAGQITQLRDSIGRKKIIRKVRRAEMENGCRDKDSLFRAIVSLQTELRYAYNRTLRSRPLRAGYIITRIWINAVGETEKVRMLESTMHDTAFEQEVINRISAWKFGQDRRKDCAAVVIWPFFFTQ
jgi:hypothetical protein